MPKQGVGIKIDVRYSNNASKDEKDRAIDKALKKFKRKIKKSNLMLEIFDNEFYTKPSTKKREKKLKAISRNKYKLDEFKRTESGI